MKWNGWIEIQKVSSDDERIVEGFASTEQPDDQGGVYQGRQYEGDVIDAEAIKAALPDYMEWANLREMHQLAAVGTVIKAEVIEGEVVVDGKVYRYPLHIIAKVVDDAAWEKVRSGVYKGFSIGAHFTRAVIEKLAGKVIRRITELSKLYEISLVDRPANPGARLLLWKASGEPETEAMQAGESDQPGENAMEDIQKAAADPAKILSGLQALRDEAELAGELESAALYTQAIALLMQASGEAEEEASETESEEAPPEGESVPEEAAPEGGDSGTKPEEELLLMASGAKAGGMIHKAGRTFSTSNQQAMHGVIQALAKLLSGAGDTVADQVLSCYGSKEQPEKIAAAAPTLDAGVLQKAVQDALGNLETISKLDTVLTGLSERIESLERLPQGGGPVLRSVEKVIAGQESPVQATAEAHTGPTIAELRKLAATEPEPIRKAEYARQLWAAEHATAKRHG